MHRERNLAPSSSLNPVRRRLAPIGVLAFIVGLVVGFGHAAGLYSARLMAEVRRTESVKVRHHVVRMARAQTAPDAASAGLVALDSWASKRGFVASLNRSEPAAPEVRVAVHAARP